tara:strand:- start:616 stop:1095 length:480 start_codon:yes stop_codon:yes gene_type:complete
MYGFSAFSQSPYSTLGGPVVKTGAAQIEGTGTVTASALRERTAIASINAIATLTANANYVAFGSGDIIGRATLTVTLSGSIIDAEGSIIGIATLSADGEVTITSIASITGVGTVIAKGYLLGEEWTDVPVETNIWSTVTAGSDVWTDSTVGTNDWKRKG